MIKLAKLKRKVKETTLEPMKNDTYLAALQKNGLHHGWYLQQLNLSDAEIEKGIKSFSKQIDKHRKWIDNPLTKIPDFGELHPDQQKHLIERKWPQDIQRQQDQMAILKGVLKERNNGKSR